MDLSTTQKHSKEADLISELCATQGPFLGAAHARIAIVVFEDLECPFCKDSMDILKSEVLPKYADQIRILVQPRPIGSHVWAEQAAETSMCAYEEGGNDAYWKVHDFILKRQDAVQTSNVQSVLNAAIHDAAIDANKVSACVLAGRGREIVEQGLLAAARLDVFGTPTLFINARRFEGTFDWSEFRAVLDQAFKRSK